MVGVMRAIVNDTCSAGSVNESAAVARSLEVDTILKKSIRNTSSRLKEVDPGDNEAIMTIFNFTEVLNDTLETRKTVFSGNEFGHLTLVFSNSN